MKHIFVILSLLGVIKCEIEPFVVGGEVANIRQFAHSVFLHVRCSKTKQGYICGASIVNQRIMLTTAHCVDCCTFQTMTVSVGHSNRDKGTVFEVDSALPHENYYKQYLENDIALIRLKKDLTFSYDVRRVAIMKYPPYFEKAYVAGWGMVTEDSKKKEKILYDVDQYVWTPPQCKKASKNLPRGTFCASSKKYDSFVAEGDSGSALVVKGYIQIGIVSFKLRSGIQGLTIYSDVGYYYDWITKNTANFYCDN